MESVKRVPVVQQVVEKIKEYLFSGEVSVGDKLPVEKIVRTIGSGPWYCERSLPDAGSHWLCGIKTRQGYICRKDF